MGHQTGRRIDKNKLVKRRKEGVEDGMENVRTTCSILLYWNELVMDKGTICSHTRDSSPTKNLAGRDVTLSIVKCHFILVM